MGHKFHHNYSQSEATKQGYRCNPLWRTQLGSGNPPKIISTQPHLQISKGENPTQSNSQWNWHIREIPNLQERR